MDPNSGRQLLMLVLALRDSTIASSQSLRTSSGKTLEALHAPSAHVRSAVRYDTNRNCEVQSLDPSAEGRPKEILHHRGEFLAGEGGGVSLALATAQKQVSQASLGLFRSVA